MSTPTASATSAISATPPAASSDGAPPPTAVEAPTSQRRRRGINMTYLGLELKRQFRDPVHMFFVAILPAFLYLIFGAAQGDGSEAAGPHGNVSMYVMISMAAYGAVTATASIGGDAALERMQGWARQLGLTSMRDGEYVAVKATVAALIAIVPIALIFALGVVSGAQARALAWVLSPIIVLLGAAVFALWGLVFGLAFRSESALSAAVGSLVILAFLGNVFFPLSGALLTFAQFTPLFGFVALARYPINEGWTPNGPEGELIHIDLWVPLVNLGVWALILAVTATLLVRRGRGRQ